MSFIIKMTVYLAITALVLLIFKKAFKSKLSAKLQLLVWMLLFVRFLIPELPQSDLSLFNAVPAEYTYQQNIIEPINTQTAVEGERTETAQGDIKNNKGHITESLWALGAAGLFSYFVIVYLINLKKLRKARLINDEDTVELLLECKELLGIKRNIKIISGTTPMLLGELRPKIIMPKGYNREEEKSIILHELCHLKNHDIFMIWIAVLVLCFNWFNPIIWYSFFVFKKDIEVYCDERVLKYRDNKKEYAELLLKTALKKNKFILGTTSLQNGEKEVERRIKHMAYFKKPKIIWSVIIAAAAVIITVLCLTNQSEECSMSREKYDEYINRDIGAIMAEIDYADEERVVFHYLDGMFVYDMEKEKLEHSLDISKLNHAGHHQGSNGIQVSVSENGKRALIANYGPEDEIKDFNNYIINLSNGKALQTKKEELENPFKRSMMPYNSGEIKGWTSIHQVDYEDKIYYLVIADGHKVYDIKIVVQDKEGNVLESFFPFSGERYFYDKKGFSFVSPTNDIIEAKSYEYANVSDNELLLVERIWFKPDELEGKENTLSEGAELTQVYGYTTPVVLMKKDYDGKNISSYFIRYPDEGGTMIVMSFKTGRFSEEEIKLMLSSLDFKISPLYEKTKSYLENEFYRVYSPYYDIVDLQISNWHQEGNEATFFYKMVHKTYNRDPDTVGYIQEAKVRGEEEYKRLYEDYLDFKEANYEFKVVLESDTLELFSNVSPKGIEWKATKIEDYILKR